MNIHIDKTHVGEEESFCTNIFPQTAQHFGANSSHLSDIFQCDGADSVSNSSSNNSMCSYDSEEEVDSAPVRAVVIPCEE